MLKLKQFVFSFGEILHHCDKTRTNVIHTKVFFEKKVKKTLDFEEFVFEIWPNLDSRLKTCCNMLLKYNVILHFR
jgi:hypothetical protein